MKPLIALFAVFFSLTTVASAQVSKEDRSELFLRVEQMCQNASTSGEILSFEGDLSAGAVLRVVGVEASGRVKKQQWENIQQLLGDGRTDPTVCRFEMFKLLLPLFEGVSDQEYKRITDTCQDSGALRICVKSQDLKLFGSNLRVPITVEPVNAEKNVSFRYNNGGGAILTDSGEEFLQDKPTSTIRIYSGQVFSDVFIAKLLDPNGINEIAVQIVLKKPATEVFFDGLRVPVK